MITVKLFRGSMKMKIWTVAVFCAYLAAASGEEFNSTMRSKLTGKSLAPAGSHQQPRRPRYTEEITKKLSTIILVDAENNGVSLGVLLGRKRMAIPASYERFLKTLEACVHCIKVTTKGQKMVRNCIAIEKKVLEGDGFYFANMIIEIEILAEIGRDCWPEGEERYTEPAENIVEGNNATAIGLPCGAENLIPKPFTIFKADSGIVKINEPSNPSDEIYVPGEPLFYGKQIAGMFIEGFSSSSYPQVSYVRLQKQSNAGSRS